MTVFYSAFLSSRHIRRRAGGCRFCALALMCRPPASVSDIPSGRRGIPRNVCMSLPNSTASNPNRGHRTLNIYRPTNLSQSDTQSVSHCSTNFLYGAACISALLEARQCFCMIVKAKIWCPAPDTNRPSAG